MPDDRIKRIDDGATGPAIKLSSPATLTVLTWSMLIAGNCITQMNTTLKDTDASSVILGNVGLWTAGVVLIALLGLLMGGKK